MTLDAEQIETRIKQSLPDARITIDDPRGDGNYLIVQVADAAFAGLSRIEQHRLVYKALLGEEMLEPLPVLALRTIVA